MMYNYFIALETFQTYDFSGLMQNIGLGLLALLTPVALFVLGTSKDEGTREIDKLVLIDQVLLPRILAFSSILIFVPQFFYDIEGLRFLAFFLFSIGALSIIIILQKCYLWFKCVEATEDKDNFREQCRDVYYDKNKDWGSKKNIWSITWQGKMVVATEVNRIKKFIKDVDQLIDEGNIEMANTYLSSFNEFIEKRYLGDSNVFRILWSKILEWHLKYHSPYLPEDIDIPKMELQGTINTILNKVFESSLINNTAFPCFRELKTHISGKDEGYVHNVLLTPTHIFFENIAKSSSKYDIWEHYFPNEWKITVSNLSTENNIVVWIWTDRFFNWAVPRFGGSIDFDDELNAVVYGLFPSVDVATWSRILQYACNPWINDERIKSLLESKRSFGFISHSVSYSSPIDVDAYMDSKKLEAYKLALKLFVKEFSKNNLEKNIAELRSVNYESDTYQEHNRLVYIELFEGILGQLS